MLEENFLGDRALNSNLLGVETTDETLNAIARYQSRGLVDLIVPLPSVVSPLTRNVDAAIVPSETGGFLPVDGGDSAIALNNADGTDPITGENQLESTEAIAPLSDLESDRLFDPTYYAQTYPDLAAAGLTSPEQLYIHFRTFGLAEERQFSLFIDLSFYQLNNPDLTAAGLTTPGQLYQHLQNFGIPERRQFSPWVDLQFYLDNNTDLKQAFGDNTELAFEHLTTFGFAEKRQFSSKVDLNFYLNSNADLKQAFGDNLQQAFEHLQTIGITENRLFIPTQPNVITPVTQEDDSNVPTITPNDPENNNSNPIPIEPSPSPNPEEQPVTGETDPEPPLPKDGVSLPPKDGVSLPPKDGVSLPPKDGVSLPPKDGVSLPDRITPNGWMPSPLTPPQNSPNLGTGKNPQKNTAPKHLQFTTDNQYFKNQTVRLTKGWVFDENGASDIDYIEFSLEPKGNPKAKQESSSDIIDATSLIINSQDPRWGLIDYELKDLEPGQYQLKAVAYDETGSQSNVHVESFTILNELAPNKGGASPEDLKFSILPLYTNGETLSFGGATVTDADGANDLEIVDFWLQTPTGGWKDISDATNFTEDSEGKARFDFSYDLSNIAPGSYKLWAIAYDNADNPSNVSSQEFAVITDPGEDGLSDPVRLAIAESGNLDRYEPDALDRTTEWLVFVTPGQSPDTLATQLNAKNLGESGHIPNTYIWEFSDTLDAEDIAKQLKQLEGVEFAYPLVPLAPELLSESNDPLVPEQIFLQSGVNPYDTNVTKAWDIPLPSDPSKTVQGRGVVIGIVDDGLQTTHPDLAGRYLGTLSYDFNENDNDPSPKYTATIQLDLKNNGGKFAPSDYDVREFYLESALTGVVKDLKVFLDIEYPKVNEITASLIKPDINLFDPLVGAGSTRNIRGRGGTDEDISTVILFSYLGDNQLTANCDQMYHNPGKVER